MPEEEAQHELLAVFTYPMQLGLGGCVLVVAALSAGSANKLAMVSLLLDVRGGSPIENLDLQ